MTQVISITANMAAIAMEAIRPARRVSLRHQADDIREDAEHDAQRIANTDTEAEDTATIAAAALSPDLTAVGRQAHPQAGFEQANAAYRAAAED